jgi:long-chain acyl-CoA synthetase
MTNQSLRLAQSADKYPFATALRCEQTTKSYSVLASDVARFADYLIDGGVRPGDRVGIMLPNGPAFVVAFYGVLHAGGVAVPMNPSQSRRVVEFFLTITDSRALFFGPRHATATAAAAVAAGTQPVEIGRHGIARLIAGYPGRARPVPRAGDDTAVILQKAAATDGPRTAELTHGDLVSTEAVTARGLLQLGPDDVVMACLPLFEGFGITCGLIPAVCAGATLVLMPNPSNSGKQAMTTSSGPKCSRPRAVTASVLKRLPCVSSAVLGPLVFKAFCRMTAVSSAARGTGRARPG